MVWNCPKCGEEVDDAVPYCWRCGGVPEGAARPEFTRPADQPAHSQDGWATPDFDHPTGSAAGLA